MAFGCHVMLERNVSRSAFGNPASGRGDLAVPRFFSSQQEQAAGGVVATAITLCAHTRLNWGWWFGRVQLQLRSLPMWAPGLPRGVHSTIVEGLADSRHLNSVAYAGRMHVACLPLVHVALVHTHSMP